MQPLLQLKGIDKSFPGVKALSGACDGTGGRKRCREIHHDESPDRDLCS